eukprot:167055_1
MVSKWEHLPAFPHSATLNQTLYRLYLIKKKLKQGSLKLCKIFQFETHTIKCITIHSDPVKPPLTAFLNNNGFYHKIYEISFWSLHKNNETNQQEMVQDHYLEYTVHDNGVASTMSIDNAKFIISDDGKYLICEHQNKLNFINPNTIKNNKIDHRELKENESEYIEIMYNENYQRNEYYRCDMKFFYDNKLSSNLLLLIGFLTNESIKDKCIFVIIDCKTKQKIKEIRIKNDIRKSCMNFIKLNNIKIFKNAPLLNGWTTTSETGQIEIGMVHQISNAKLGMKYEISAFMSYLETNNGRQNWKYYCSLNNKYIACIKHKCENEMNIPDRTKLQINTFNGNVLDIIYESDAYLPGLFSIHWCSDDIVLFYRYTIKNKCIYVVKNAVCNSKKRMVMINLINERFGNGYDDIVEILLSMIGFEIDNCYHVKDIANKDFMSVYGFCDDKENVYCVYAGPKHNIKLVKL